MRMIVTKNVFFAISDPTRRAVLDLLAAGSRTAGAIAARFPRLTQPGISKHLKVLRDTELVDVTVRAQERIYSIKPQGLAERYEWVAKHPAPDPRRVGSPHRVRPSRPLVHDTGAPRCARRGEHRLQERPGAVSRDGEDSRVATTEGLRTRVER